MSFQPDELDQPQTDQGVPVGGADVEQDRLNAGGDKDTDRDTDLADGDWAAQEGGSTDQGVPVGTADAEEDRRNAAESSDPAI
jgi:hypothetical protein